jgi:hypothetical protein
MGKAQAAEAPRRVTGLRDLGPSEIAPTCETRFLSLRYQARTLEEASQGLVLLRMYHIVSDRPNKERATYIRYDVRYLNGTEHRRQLCGRWEQSQPGEFERHQ